MKQILTLFTVAVLLIASTASAQDTALVVKAPPGTYVLTIAANGTASLAPTAVVTPGIVTVVTPDPVIPGPGPDVDPGMLSEFVAAATDRVPEYALKAQDRRAMAFSLTFLSQAIPSDDAPATAARKLLRDACDTALAERSANWSAWWTSVDAMTANMTTKQLKAAIPEVTDGLTQGLSASSGNFQGVENFGLGEGVLAELFKLLMPFLLQMLTQLLSR